MKKGALLVNVARAAIVDKQVCFAWSCPIARALWSALPGAAPLLKLWGYPIATAPLSALPWATPLLQP